KLVSPIIHTLHTRATLFPYTTLFRSQSPTNSDPFSLELDRENQRNEKQRRTAEERELRIACRAGERFAFEQHEQSEQRRQRKCRSEEHTSELQSPDQLVCRLLLEKSK